MSYRQECQSGNMVIQGGAASTKERWVMLNDICRPWMFLLCAMAMVLVASAAYSQEVSPGSQKLPPVLDPPPVAEILPDLEGEPINSTWNLRLHLSGSPGVIAGVALGGEDLMANGPSLLDAGRGLLNEQANTVKLVGSSEATTYLCLAELHWQLASKAFTAGDTERFAAEYQLFNGYLENAETLTERLKGTYAASAEEIYRVSQAADAVMNLSAPLAPVQSDAK